MGPGCLAAGDPSLWNELKTRAALYDQQLALGLHPWWCELDTWTHWVDRIPVDTIDAIGEIGLDRLRGDPNAQRRATVAQLELAHRHDLPVVVHCVRAHEGMATLLQNRTHRGMMHGWTGSTEQLPPFLNAGLHIGFGPALLRSTKIQRACAAVPADRLLFESDSFDDDDSLERVLVQAADLRRTSVDELARLQAVNVQSLFPGGSA